MCIALWLWESHPQYRLLLLLNRDEVHSRPTQAVHWWEDENDEIVGGKDIEAGGTWLASSRNGRLAFVTNFREPTSIPAAKSRGELVPRFFKSSKTPMEFAQEVAQEGKEYNGFNLILMDLCSSKIAYVTNRREGTSVYVQEVSSGLHVLCNAQLDVPWPKGPYGTRSMVVLSVKPTGQLTFYEQYLEEGKWREHKITYEIESHEWNHERKVFNG